MNTFGEERRSITNARDQNQIGVFRIAGEFRSNHLRHILAVFLHRANRVVRWSAIAFVTYPLVFFEDGTEMLIAPLSEDGIECSLVGAHFTSACLVETVGVLLSALTRDGRERVVACAVNRCFSPTDR